MTDLGLFLVEHLKKLLFFPIESISPYFTQSFACPRSHIVSVWVLSITNIDSKATHKINDRSTKIFTQASLTPISSHVMKVRNTDKAPKSIAHIFFPTLYIFSTFPLTTILFANCVFYSLVIPISFTVFSNPIRWDVNTYSL